MNSHNKTKYRKYGHYFLFYPNVEISDKIKKLICSTFTYVRFLYKFPLFDPVTPPKKYFCGNYLIIKNFLPNRTLLGLFYFHKNRFLYFDNHVMPSVNWNLY